MEIVKGDQYLNEFKELIIEYTNNLNRDLGFQNLDSELLDLKQKYTYPNGQILVALSKNKIIGCVAFYRHDNKRCEMKRLYVKPEFRQQQAGKLLVKKIIQLAKQLGYQEMVLDTIKPLTKAIALYQKYGFIEIPPYYHNPMDDVIYMRLDLREGME